MSRWAGSTLSSTPLGRQLRIGDVAPATSAIAADGDSVWVAPTGGRLTLLNATTGTITKSWDPNASPVGVAVGEGAVWLTDNDANNVVRVDPTGVVTPIAVGDGPAASRSATARYGSSTRSTTGSSGSIRAPNR